jgi:hypothetical protein
MEQAIHMIGSVGSEGGIRWRVAPESEPAVPDAVGSGFKVTAKGPEKNFAVVAKRGN